MIIESQDGPVASTPWLHIDINLRVESANQVVTTLYLDGDFIFQRTFGSVDAAMQSIRHRVQNYTEGEAADEQQRPAAK